ncbi:MAG: glycosyltransferase [Gammaproteobacteria bacterium RIFCSPHIGHO2_12_FULL_41_20]|nr:MAG: glycosyltransferase [Gammaproteobacteria bacterium RIFCSPHIGHO2_12_FULL_41_20]
MSQPLVSILIPNYKTLELTKLCLRLLRKYTRMEKIKVIVIDNASQDASLDYLRTLAWIELIERQAISGESPVQAHSRALDLALARVATPYVLSIHTDTLVKHPMWLEFLISEIEHSPRIAGVGSWKLECKPYWQQVLKAVESKMQQFYYQLIGKTQHGLQGVGENYFYLRSHCAMYRTEILQELNLHFSDGDAVAGKVMYKSLVDAGYEMVFLSPEKLVHYLEHINHATVVLNPELSSRKKSVTKGLRRIKKTLADLNADKILQDVQLDN